MTWELAISLFSVLIAAVSLGWTITYNRRTTFINTVTSERTKWIAKLRDNLSMFVGKSQTFMWMSKDKVTTEKLDDLRRELDILRYEIKLQLNPTDYPDKLIIQKINEIPNLVSHQDAKTVSAAIDELINLGQRLLKTEWEKVKAEALQGAFATSEKRLT